MNHTALLPLLRVAVLLARIVFVGLWRFFGGVAQGGTKKSGELGRGQC
jgi:hypothetical protein